MLQRVENKKQGDFLIPVSYFRHRKRKKKKNET